MFGSTVRLRLSSLCSVESFFRASYSSFAHWAMVRASCLGLYGKKRNIKKAIQDASACSHPDAIWLSKLFDGKDIESEDDALQVFDGQSEDARAMFFGGILKQDLAAVIRSADGYGFAKVVIGDKAEKESAFRLAEEAALTGEPCGFSLLAKLKMRGCRGKDLEKHVLVEYKRLLLAAAEQGEVRGRKG